MISRLALLASAIAFSSSVLAQDVGPLGADTAQKAVDISRTGCPDGEAVTYTMQCDVGTRQPIQRIFYPSAPGVEICRVNGWHCSLVIGPNLHPTRPGHEVLDSAEAGDLATVTFGMDRLLGQTR